MNAGGCRSSGDSGPPTLVSATSHTVRKPSSSLAAPVNVDGCSFVNAAGTDTLRHDLGAYHHTSSKIPASNDCNMAVVMQQQHQRAPNTNPTILPPPPAPNVAQNAGVPWAKINTNLKTAANSGALQRPMWGDRQGPNALAAQFRWAILPRGLLFPNCGWRRDPRRRGPRRHGNHSRMRRR